MRTQASDIQHPFMYLCVISEARYGGTYAAFERRRQEDLEFKTNVNYLERPCLWKQKKEASKETNTCLFVCGVCVCIRVRVWVHTYMQVKAEGRL